MGSCVLQNAIIGAEAVVEAKCHIKDSQVGPKCCVAANCTSVVEVVAIVAAHTYRPTATVRGEQVTNTSFFDAGGMEVGLSAGDDFAAMVLDDGGISLGAAAVDQ